MEFITGDIKRFYRKFLTVSMASAMVMSIYSFFDHIAVVKSEGPVGVTAKAVIKHLYGLLVFLGVLCGVGGSVLYGNTRAECEVEKVNVLFTVATWLMLWRGTGLCFFTSRFLRFLELIRISCCSCCHFCSVNRAFGLLCLFLNWLLPPLPQSISRNEHREVILAL